MYPKRQQGILSGDCKSAQICNNNYVPQPFLGWRQVKSGVLVNSSIVLVCAVLASLAIGVLAAYGLCIAMFKVFRIHARQVAVKSARRVVVPARVAQG
jgi:hypothetical protein